MGMVVENDRFRIKALDSLGRKFLHFACKASAGDWHTVAGTGLITRPNIYSDEIRLVTQDPEIEWSDHDSNDVKASTVVFNTVEKNVSPNSLLLSGEFDGHVIQEQVIAKPSCIRVEVRVSLAAGAPTPKIGKLLTHLYFIPDEKAECATDPVDFAWIPNLHKTEDHICSDHFFRSPAACVAANGYYAAVVPDLDVFDEYCALPHAIDYRTTGGLALEAPRLSYGICQTVVDEHVYARHQAGQTFEPESLEFRYAFDLFIDVVYDALEPARRITSYMWERYGHRTFGDPKPQVLPFGEYGNRYTYRHELPLSTRTVQIEDDVCTGIENIRRHGSNFHAWENDLAVGFGVRYYSGKWADKSLAEIGNGILNLFLASPRKGGAFPCVYNFETGEYEGTLQWVARAVDAKNCYDTGAMGVSTWWLLYWDEVFDLGPAPLKTAMDYGRFLMTAQLPSGAIPTYFHADMSPAKQLLESGTTAISGAILAKLARISDDSGESKTAAVAAGRFVEQHILPRHGFSDFETFYSCSPKPLHAIDYFSGIFPHCNLAIQWACDMFLQLFLLTGDNHWLLLGEYTLSLLSLYQQVWNPSHRSGYLYGGFGVMNTDGEWNDGRQSRFVSTYADYYRQTKNIEYLERGVAACRASFALMDIPENHENSINHLVQGENFNPANAANGKAEPGKGYAPENIHHSGNENHRGTWTGMSFSAGGGLSASAYLDYWFGTVWIDESTKTATPIDGVYARVESWSGPSIELSVRSALSSLPLPYTRDRQIQLKFGSLVHPTYQLAINGENRGAMPRRELEKGFSIKC